MNHDKEFFIICGASLLAAILLILASTIPLATSLPKTSSIACTGQK